MTIPIHLPHAFIETLPGPGNTVGKKQRQSCLHVAPQKAVDQVLAQLCTVLIVTTLWYVLLVVLLLATVITLPKLLLRARSSVPP